MPCVGSPLRDSPRAWVRHMRGPHLRIIKCISNQSSQTSRITLRRGKKRLNSGFFFLVINIAMIKFNKNCDDFQVREGVKIFQSCSLRHSDVDIFLPNIYCPPSRVSRRKPSGYECYSIIDPRDHGAMLTDYRGLETRTKYWYNIMLMIFRSLNCGFYTIQVVDVAVEAVIRGRRLSVPRMQRMKTVHG